MLFLLLFLVVMPSRTKSTSQLQSRKLPNVWLVNSVLPHFWCRLGARDIDNSRARRSSNPAVVFP